MVVDALRAYVQLASGLTEVTLERAKTAAKALVTQAGSLSEAPAESAAQVRAMADELMKTAKDNRDLVLGMIRTEVERAVGAMGVVAAEDFAALQRRLADLEDRFRGSGQPSAPGAEPSAPAEPAQSASADASGEPEAADTDETSDPMEAAEPRPDASAGTEPPASDAADAPEAVAEGESSDVADAPEASDADQAAGGRAEEPATETAPSGATADFEIPTPVAVERVVAKKRAAERDWDETPDEHAGIDGASDDSAGASSDSANASDGAAQDPSPPDVSTT